MKNEKVCISKSVAFIAVVAVLLLGVVLFANYMNSQNLANNPKAEPPSGRCFYSGFELSTTSSPWRYDDETFCIESTSDVNVGYQCNHIGAELTGGSTKKLEVCPLPEKEPRTECIIGGKKLSQWNPPYSMDTSNTSNTSQCILNGAGKWTGYYCDVEAGYISSYDLSKCPQTAAVRTSCQYGGQTIKETDWVTIGRYEYMIDENGCLIESANAANGGTTTRFLGLKCNDATLYRTVKDTSCKQPTVARTACKWNQIELPVANTIGTSDTPTYGTAVMAGNGAKYSLESPSGCIVDAATKINNGYYCDANLVSSYNLKLCPNK